MGQFRNLTLLVGFLMTFTYLNRFSKDMTSHLKPMLPQPRELWWLWWNGASASVVWGANCSGILRKYMEMIRHLWKYMRLCSLLGNDWHQPPGRGTIPTAFHWFSWLYLMKENMVGVEGRVGSFYSLLGQRIFAHPEFCCQVASRLEGAHWAAI